MTAPTRPTSAPHDGLRTATAVTLLGALFAASVGVQVVRDRLVPRATIDDAAL